MRKPNKRSFTCNYVQTITVEADDEKSAKTQLAELIKKETGIKVQLKNINDPDNWTYRETTRAQPEPVFHREMVRQTRSGYNALDFTKLTNRVDQNRHQGRGLTTAPVTGDPITKTGESCEKFTCDHSIRRCFSPKDPERLPQKLANIKESGLVVEQWCSLDSVWCHPETCQLKSAIKLFGNDNYCTSGGWPIRF